MVNAFRRALLLIVLCAHEAGAQDYPSRTIRIVVAYPPGGVTDTIARIVGQKISENVGQAVVVENRPGASGLVGSQAAMSASPDGYTLLLATPTVEARPRFDPTRDALPITMVARTSVVLSTKADGPLNSVAAFVAAAKQSPGKVTFGTTGAGSINQLAGEWLAADAGLKMLHVPYRGGGPAANALLAGDIEATFLTASSVSSLVDAGKLRVLAVASKERMTIAPSWPTSRRAVTISKRRSGLGCSRRPRRTQMSSIGLTVWSRPSLLTRTFKNASTILVSMGRCLARTPLQT